MICSFRNKFFGHLKTVYTHRKWVRRYCFYAKMYWQGLTHDLSKYNPVEFFESVKYYQGTRSPIDAAKESKGCSDAWLHHKTHNKHHREYWTDNYDSGTASICMPSKYAKEMLCDFLGAGRAYMGKDFTYQKEWDWWNNKLKEGIAIHPETAYFITAALYDLKETEDFVVLNNLSAYTSLATRWFVRTKCNTDVVHSNLYYYGSSKNFYEDIIMDGGFYDD